MAYIQTKVRTLQMSEDGTQKRVSATYLVEAVSVDMAITISTPVLSKSVSDYEIVSINKTSIKQVFTYQN